MMRGFVLFRPFARKRFYAFRISIRRYVWKAVAAKIKRLCPDGQFTCGDKTCVSIIARCDHHVDCPHDRADEEGCRMS